LPAPDVVCFPNGPFAENCYLVADAGTREAVLVDPGEEAELFLSRLTADGLRLTAIWLTHAHIDHVAGVSAVKAAWDVPILLHPADRPLYDHAPEQAALFGLHMDTLPPVDDELADGQSVSVGPFAFEVRHTPGHSPGSVSFIGHGLALSGDVLFAGSVGRTDLPGGDTDTLMTSIKTRLYTLPDDTAVLSGHGPETTIGAEKRSNPFVRLVAGVNACLRCGAEVRGKPWGCKNPCANCGFVYPLGDCSD
jgi:glyoxylase-like metal-dependent hydrolase (beta-lactamase superfamily II)